jgi:hypothetical protein
MATVWITYAWKDNETHDVDFIAQELQALGLQVKLDRWNIQAGNRLWTQIEKFIQSDAESDAWILYATQNSLSSEPCREEYSYALDRALSQRGPNFPVIGLFPSPVEKSLIPAGIRTRLYVSTTDPDWKERILAAVQGRSVAIPKPLLEPYSLKVHSVEGGYLIEVRPRAGVWFPFSFAVPDDEKEKIGEHRPTFLFAAPGQPPPPPEAFILQFDAIGPSTGGDGTRWWTISPSGEVTPAKSFFIFAKEIPSVIAFGPRNGPLFKVERPV